jgi:hypothetical protein
MVVIVLLSDRTDIQKADVTHPEEPREELHQPDEQGQPARNPLAGLLNAIAVIASGVFAGLLGTSQQEKKALQSTISSVCIYNHSMKLLYFYHSLLQNLHIKFMCTEIKSCTEEITRCCNLVLIFQPKWLNLVCM